MIGVGVVGTVGSATPGQVVLRCIRKQVEKVISEQASKQHPSTASASAPASRFLPWFPPVMDYDVEG